MRKIQFDLIVFDLAGTTVYDRDDVSSCLRETLSQRADLDVTLKEANTLLGRAKDVGLAELLTNHGKPHSPDDAFVQALLTDFERPVGRLDLLRSGQERPARPVHDLPIDGAARRDRRSPRHQGRRHTRRHQDGARRPMRANGGGAQWITRR